jgi:catechol 2,3-dioxygenase-like lactoylglutathione lyase family enzyme
MVRAREFRFVVVTSDYEAATLLFRDVFEFEALMDLEGQEGRGIILRLPAATLEVVDAAHDRMVDEIEVGQPQDNHVRIAVRVDDLAAASHAVTGTGAKALAAAVDTPWRDRNQRFVAKDGLQLTLFQPL